MTTPPAREREQRDADLMAFHNNPTCTARMPALYAFIAGRESARAEFAKWVREAVEQELADTVIKPDMLLEIVLNMSPSARDRFAPKLARALARVLDLVAGESEVRGGT